MADLENKYLDSTGLKILLNRIAEMFNYLNKSVESVSGAAFAKVAYDSDAKAIYFYNADGGTVGTVDATDFIKDGMLNTAELVDADAEGNEGKYIYLAWNTDAGIDDMYVDVSDLVDTYTAGDGLALDDGEFSGVIDPDSDEYLTLSSAGFKLSGVKSAIDAEATAREAADETLQASIDTNTESISKLQTVVDTLADSVLTESSDYYMGKWEDGEASPDAVSLAGNKETAGCWRPYLVNREDNAGDTTTGYELDRVNWLRYKDGTYAPTVGVTEEQYAECDVALYLDDTGSDDSLYCEAGAFDAESFYNEYGVGQRLYDAEGNEISHIRRPWETVETKYCVLVGNKHELWLVDNVVGDDGYRVKGVSSKGGTYDGINFTGYHLPPTGLSPCPVTTIDGKATTFFFAYGTGETNCGSGNGQNDSSLCSMFTDLDRTFPRAGDVSQITCMRYARANNVDTESSVPFAEGGEFAYNTFITCVELLAGTKYLIDPAMYGSGISSDDSCSSEDTWKANGGTRYRVQDSGDDWTYKTWGSSGDIYYDADGNRTHMSSTLNYEWPKEQCLEAQMALSYAMETGVAEDDEFEFYGGTYWWENVDGVDGVSEGHMNARVYKLMAGTVNGYDADGNATVYDVEVVLRMSLFEGMSLAGDVFAYWGGGLENIGTYVEGAGTDTLDIYLEPDQTKWAYVTDYSKADLGVFDDIEGAYAKLGTATDIGSSWTKERMSYSPVKTASGGARNTYECYYSYDSCSWSSTVDQRVRIGARRRGSAYNGYCSPRLVTAINNVAYTARAYAGSAQALLSPTEGSV